MSFAHIFGHTSESEAAQFFELKTGARLLIRNFRRKVGEIDLIFEQPKPAGLAPELVFVEVRARATGSRIRGVDSVSAKKRARLRRVITAFLARYHGPCETMRLDILDWDGRGWIHIQNQRLE